MRGRAGDGLCPRALASVLALGLNFALLGALPTGPAAGDQAWPRGNARWVDALVRDLLGRPSTAADQQRWTTALDHGRPRAEVAQELAHTPEWARVVVGDLFDRILGRRPDPSGLAHWSAQLQAGRRTAGLAASLYASSEFYRHAGGTVAGYVDGVYRNVLGRGPDPDGRSYWVARLAAGAPRDRIAGQLFLSVESNGRRVDGLYRALLDRAPDPSGRAFWARQLVHRDDLDLAGLLVASDEYYRRAQGPGVPAPALGRPAVDQTPSVPPVWDNSDPAVLVDGGRTWLFGSTNNMKLPVREIRTFAGSLEASRQEWATSPRDAMPDRPAWVRPGPTGSWEIWAPSVARIGPRYVAWFAARRAGVIADPVNDQCVGRAFASSPQGPYAPEPAPVYCGYPAEGPVGSLPASNAWGRGSLDPEVFRAPDGSLYLLVALSRTIDNIGVLTLTADGSVVGGVNATPTTLVRQVLEWHDGRFDGRLDPSRGFLENPTMTYDAATGTYLLFYSAGPWYAADYVTGFARCATPVGPCTPDTRGPFLRAGPQRTGPGGLTVFRDPYGVLRVAYATWQVGHEHPVDPTGEFQRRTHWAELVLSPTADPAAQSVSIR